MNTTMRFLIGSAILAVLTSNSLPGQPPAAKAGKALPPNAADEAAVRAAGKSLLKAYVAGDAAALAAHWTVHGEYQGEDGTSIRGRAKIEKAYAGLFTRKPQVTTAEREITSLRFPSRDTALEEGLFKVRTGKEAPVVSKYSVLHVREDGKWLMALVREWPHAGTSLHELEWLIGSWVARRGDVEIHSTYDWWAGKSFLRLNLTLKQGDRTITGFQMITRDGATGRLRSWTFDSEGNFGEAGWAREGNRWVQDSAGVLPDGTTVSATNILTRLDDDTFTFQSVERTVGGEEAPEVPPVRVTRVKSK